MHTSYQGGSIYRHLHAGQACVCISNWKAMMIASFIARGKARSMGLGIALRDCAGEGGSGSGGNGTQAAQTLQHANLLHKEAIGYI